MTATLQTIGPDLWTLEADLKTAAGAVHFPLRMTVMRDDHGDLILWSPVPMDEAQCEAITDLGTVASIVAPNGYHHLYASAAANHFPGAQLWLSPALEGKRSDLTARGQRLDAPPRHFQEQLELVRIEGMPAVQECVAFHRPSASLVTTDLVFNMHQTSGWAMPLILRMAGTWKKLAQSRLLRSQIRDRDAARRSFEKLLALPFERLIMAHGALVEQGARRQLASALSWLDPHLRQPASQDPCVAGLR